MKTESVIVPVARTLIQTAPRLLSLTITIHRTTVRGYPPHTSFTVKTNSSDRCAALPGLSMSHVIHETVPGHDKNAVARSPLDPFKWVIETMGTRLTRLVRNLAEAINIYANEIPDPPPGYI